VKNLAKVVNLMFSLKLDSEQIIKLLKSAVVAGLGAAAFYALEGIGKLDCGIYTPLVVALCSWLVNLLKVYLKK
jgi:hypothetical protein